MIKVFDRKDIGQGARSAEMFNILSYRDTSIFQQVRNNHALARKKARRKTG
jgi:hypothetical protein